MGISSTTNRVSYMGDGSSATFPFAYYFDGQADLKVFLYGSSAGSITAQVLNTNYTVSGTPNAEGIYTQGGSVIFASAIPSTHMVVITRDPSQIQDYALLQGGAINSKALVNQLDYMTLLIQRLQDEATRNVGLRDGHGSAFDTKFPPQALTACSVIMVNSSATGFAVGPNAGQIAAAQSSAVLAVQAAADAGAFAGAAFNSMIAASGSEINAAASAVLAGSAALSASNSAALIGSSAIYAVIAQSAALSATNQAVLSASGALSASNSAALAASAALSASNQTVLANSAAVSAGASVVLIGSTAFWGTAAQSAALSATNQAVLAASAAVSAGALVVLANSASLSSTNQSVLAASAALSAFNQVALSASGALSASNSAALAASGALSATNQAVLAAASAAQASSSAGSISVPIPVISGGTGVQGFAQFAVLVGNGNSAVTTTGVAIAGNLLSAASTGSPVWAAPSIHNNLLINSGFDWWQATPNGSSLPNGQQGYFADQWYINNFCGPSAVITCSRIATVVGGTTGDGAINDCQVQITTAPTAGQANGCELWQVFENTTTMAAFLNSEGGVFKSRIKAQKRR